MVSVLGPRLKIQVSRPSWGSVVLCRVGGSSMGDGEERVGSGIPK